MSHAANTSHHSEPTARPVLWASIGTSSLALVLWTLAALFPDGKVWDGLAPSRAQQHAEYGEANLVARSIRQPWNSWSNLAYAWVGFFALARTQRSSRDPRSLLDQHPVFNWLIGLSLLYLALGSFFFHASQTRLGQQFDVASMYAVAASLLAFGIFRWLHRPANTRALCVALTTVLLFADAFFFVGKWWMNARIALPALLLALVMVNAAWHLRWRTWRGVWLALAAAALMVVAYAVREVDARSLALVPASVRWLGHAAWHLLTAASLAVTYLYFRISKPTAP